MSERTGELRKRAALRLTDQASEEPLLDSDRRRDLLARRPAIEQ